jgi:hypothetical protein
MDVDDSISLLKHTHETALLPTTRGYDRWHTPRQGRIAIALDDTHAMQCRIAIALDGMHAIM